MPTTLVRRKIMLDRDDLQVLKIERSKVSGPDRKSWNDLVYIPIWKVKEFFEEKITGPYLVEYRVRARGKYLVDDDHYNPAIAVYFEGLALGKDGSFPADVESLDVCFLPDDVRGKRVDRIVRPIEEKK